MSFPVTDRSCHEIYSLDTNFAKESLGCSSSDTSDTISPWLRASNKFSYLQLQIAYGYQIWTVDTDEYTVHSSLGVVDIIISWMCDFSKQLCLYLWMDYCHEIWTEATAFEEDLLFLIGWIKVTKF